jgi:lysozyme
MDREQLRADLIRDEGWRPHVYEDSLGFFTIGYGFLVDKRRGGGLPQHVADYWLDEVIRHVIEELRRRWPDLDQQPEPVQRALVNMAYQLGVPGLLKFRRMLAALRRGDRETAAREALDSRWSVQTPNRAARVAALIRGPSNA